MVSDVKSLLLLLLPLSFTILAWCMQAGVSSVIDRLVGVRIAPVPGSSQYPHPTGGIVELSYPHGRAYALPLLLDQMSVLRAMTIDIPDPERGLPVVLHKWPITLGAMQALRELPRQSGVLDFGTSGDWRLGHEPCTWPLPPYEYEQLAACVPTSYHTWRMSWPWALGDPSKAPRFMSMCAGIKRHREGLPPLRVGLRGSYHRVRVGEHVVADHMY